MNEKAGNLCKICKYRFRRVFIPTHPENYIYTDGDAMPSGDENIIILNQCLVLGMDIDEESTVECSHFIKNEEERDEGISFFNNIQHIK